VKIFQLLLTLNGHDVNVILSPKYKAQFSVVEVIDTTWLKGWSVPLVFIEQERKREMEKNKEELHKIISIANKKDMIISEFVRESIPSEIVLKIIEGCPVSKVLKASIMIDDVQGL
jgi:hypothetical protein